MMKDHSPFILEPRDERKGAAAKTQVGVVVRMEPGPGPSLIDVDKSSNARSFKL